MSQIKHDGVMHNLFERRVPQIVGVYIAAAWMMIEIGDWVTERFMLPSVVTSYIFVLMLVFLPSVILLAFQYGRKGKDRWKKTTFIWVPLNLLLAVAATQVLIEPQSIIETRQVVDEEGNTRHFEVAKTEYRKQILLFFWDQKSNNDEDAWLKMGIPWLLSEDLRRSLFIQSLTPVDSSSLMRRIDKVVAQGRSNTPLTLQLELARNRFFDVLINGDFSIDGEEITLTSRLYDVHSGSLLGTVSNSGTELLSLIDEMAVLVKETLKTPKVPLDLRDEARVAEHVSGSLQAIESIVQSRVSHHKDNDYASEILHLENAIAKDPTSVIAKVRLATAYHLNGRTQDGLKIMEEALAQDYILTTRDKFKYRSNFHGMKGDYKSQAKVIDMWLELYPNDTSANQLMAHLQLITGIDLEKAEKSLMKLRELLPDDDSIIRDITRLHILNNDLDQAVISQQQFVDRNPQNEKGWLELADIYSRQGKLSKSRKAIERILLFNPANKAAKLQLVTIDIKLGEFEQAEAKLRTLLTDSENPDFKLQVINIFQVLYTMQGRLDALIEFYDSLEDIKQQLPGIMRIFMIEYVSTHQKIMLGQYDTAAQEFEAMKLQLQHPLNKMMDVGHFSILYQKKEVDKLEALLNDFKLFLQKHPNVMMEMGVHLGDMWVHELKGTYEQALESAIKLRDISEKSVVNSLNNFNLLSQQVEVARIMQLSGKNEAAESLLDDILKSCPAMTAALHVKLKVLVAQGRKSDALAVTQKIDELWDSAAPEFVTYKEYLALKDQAYAL